MLTSHSVEQRYRDLRDNSVVEIFDCVSICTETHKVELEVRQNNTHLVCCSVNEHHIYT